MSSEHGATCVRSNFPNLRIAEAFDRCIFITVSARNRDRDEQRVFLERGCATSSPRLPASHSFF